MTTAAEPRAVLMSEFAVGDQVRTERDETLYPSTGTWPYFRGKTGTVVTVNVDSKRPHLTEYGVAFGKVWTRADQPGVLSFSDHCLTWFKGHELQPRLAPQINSERLSQAGAAQWTIEIDRSGTEAADGPLDRKRYQCHDPRRMRLPLGDD
jgi:hypothetical protein